MFATPNSLESSLKLKELLIIDKGKAKSSVWNDIGLIAEKNEDGTASAVIPGFVACKHCYKVYKYNNETGTTTLKNHACPMKRTIRQPTLERAVGAGGSSREAKEKVAVAAVDFVCSDLRAFTAIEGNGMKVLAQAFIDIGHKFGKVDASIVLPCANTVKNYTLQRASSALEATKEVLKKPFAQSKLALSTDLWTSDYRKTSYLDLTAYWIGDDFQMHSQVLSCMELAEKKTGDNIINALRQSLERYDLNPDDVESRAYFVTDCGSNIKAALNENKRIDCAAHRLNTVLSSAWDLTMESEPSAEEFYSAAKKLVKYGKKSDLMSKLSVSLKQEVKTRWNSLYITLDSISRVYDELLQYVAGTIALRYFASIDNILLKQMTVFLKNFKEMTDLLEGDKKPTLQNVVLVFYTILFVCEHVEDDCGILKVFKVHIKNKTHEKIELKWEHWMACFLDPATRGLGMLEGEEREEKLKIVKAMVELKMVAVNIALSNEYSKSDLEQEACLPEPKKVRSGLFDRFKEHVEDSTVIAAPEEQLYLKHELKEYIGMQLIEADLEAPLAFWKKFRQRMPHLAEVAMQVLVIPATSAGSERVYSVAGRVIEERRSMLKPKTVDAILRVNSFIKQ